MDSERLCMGCIKDRGEQDECPHCGWVEGTMPESPQHLPPRTVLNEKYLIGRVLGQGGFGITYLAWDLNLNIKLAVKEYMPQDLASRAAGHSMVSAYTGALNDQFEYGLEKFLQEARTLAQFEGHPSIVSVRDFFRANGTAYLVMHYIEGVTLKGLVAEEGGALPVSKALQIMMPVLDALKEVHAVEILHRDISPDNIFINMKGQVILIDFGAARQAIGEKGRSLSIIMKPGFTPEEQYRSKGVQGPWTDIYAVAATIYRVIAGQMPPESLDRLEEDTLIPPSRMDVEIDSLQEQALLKALAVRAGDRFQSVEEFQAALLGEMPPGAAAPAAASAGQASALRPGAVPPPPPPPKVQAGGASAGAAPHGGAISPAAPPGKNKNLYLIAGGALVVLLLAGSGVFFLTRSDPEPAANGGVEINEAAGGDGPGAAVGEDGSLDDVLAGVEPGENGQNDLPEAARDIQVGAISYEGGEYTGEHDGERPHGEGSWTGAGGDEYEGSWVDGLPHGEGRWVGPDGQLYEGEWVEGKKHGYGSYVSANNVRYVGDWENDMRNGHGTSHWPNDTSYVGEWRNDIRHGYGTYTWSDGTRYEGDWQDGFQHGEGTLIYPDGTEVFGTWVNNELQQ